MVQRPTGSRDPPVTQAVLRTWRFPSRGQEQIQGLNSGKTKFIIRNPINIDPEKAGVVMLLSDKVNFKIDNLTAKEAFCNYMITLKICVIHS